MYHRRIKMKPIDVKLSTHIDPAVEYNDKGAKFKVSDHVRILKYDDVFAKYCTYAIGNLMGDDIVASFYEKRFEKQIKQSFGLKK